MAKNDRVFDELICFLGDALFQVPVRTFLDENCAIFDPSISPSDALDDHRRIHENYKKLVDVLLGGFCEDSNITVDKAVRGIKSMSEIPDLQEYFQAVFEQVLSCVDFDMFYRLMCKRNIIIQEQALMVLIAMLGSAPDSLMQADGARAQAPRPKASGDKPAPTISNQEKEDEEILQKALQESKREEEIKKVDKKVEDRNLQKTLVLSKQEASLLSKDKQIIDDDMKRLTLDVPPPRQPTKASSGGASPFKAPPAEPMLRPSLVTGMQNKMTNAQASNDWLKSAQQDASHQSPQQAAAIAQMSKLSPDELQKRQQYLKEQRDKLLAMKKQEREKQLLTAEKANPKRPGSARAARVAMENPGATSQQSEEDAKKMAMRKAIADKLRMEVIGK